MILSKQKLLHCLLRSVTPATKDDDTLYRKCSAGFEGKEAGSCCPLQSSIDLHVSLYLSLWTQNRSSECFLYKSQTLISTHGKYSVRMVNIGPADIIEGRRNIILGLIWTISKCALKYFKGNTWELTRGFTLVLHYEVQGHKVSSKGASGGDLLKWVQSQVRCRCRTHSSASL